MRVRFSRPSVSSAVAALLLTGAIFALCTTGARAQGNGSIVGIDFGLTGAANNFPQTGFVAFNISNPSTPAQLTQIFTGLSSLTSGQLTLALPQAGGRNRIGEATPVNAGAGNLFRDLATALNETTTGNTFTVSNLNADSNYFVEFWSQDVSFNPGSTYSWFDTTGAPRLLGTTTNGANSGTDAGRAAILGTSLTQFRVTGYVRSSGTGTLRFGHTDSAGTGTLNGFRISVATPEPSSLALCGLVVSGAGAVAARRRRRGA